MAAAELVSGRHCASTYESTAKLNRLALALWLSACAVTPVLFEILLSETVKCSLGYHLILIDTNAKPIPVEWVLMSFYFVPDDGLGFLSIYNNFSFAQIAFNDENLPNDYVLWFGSSFLIRRP